MTGFGATFERYSPDGPIASLRQLQALYGAIATATATDQTSVVDNEFQLYVTPHELEEFTTAQDPENTLVTLVVDLTTATPTLEEISVSPLNSEDLPKLGYARYPWGRGIDHSLTRRGAKTGSPRGTIQSYCIDCLAEWTNANNNEPAVGEVAETHPDGWVIEQLQTLGQRESIRREIDALLPDALGQPKHPRVVVTVAVRLDESELSKPPSGLPEDGVYYPGQLHVLNAGMRARKNEKLASKNTSTPSRGEGTCLVTGRETEVFGTVDDPLAFFTLQQVEKFPELQRQYAWRTHPVSSEAALLIQASTSLLEQCRHTRRGRHIYTLPYFVEMNQTRARALHTAIQEVPKNADTHLVNLQEELESSGTVEEDALRFYVIVLRQESGDINVLHELTGVTLASLDDIVTAHMATLSGPLFSLESGFAQPEEWPPIGQETDANTVRRYLASSQYVGDTLAASHESTPRMDDLREWITARLLAGRSVPVQRLLPAYVTRLAQLRRTDDESRLPVNQLKAQYVQLETLARAGRLTAPPDREELTMNPRSIPCDEFSDDTASGRHRSARDEWSLTTIRAARLRRFIATRPALRTRAERRAAFLTGVLFARFGVQQAREQPLRQTVLVQHPEAALTNTQLKRSVPRILTRITNTSWSSDLLPPHEPALDTWLTETIAAADANGWSIQPADLRFHYALGQLFGLYDTQRAAELRSAKTASSTRQVKRPDANEQSTVSEFQ